MIMLLMSGIVGIAIGLFICFICDAIENVREEQERLDERGGL